MDILQLKGVSKSFGGDPVLDKVSFSVREGELFGLIGINGCGKTTLLKLLVGFYAPDSGVVLYKGKPIEHVKNLVKKEIGFTTQENSFYSKLTVEENIRYFGSLYGLHGKTLRERTEQVLALLDLLDARLKLAEHLSGGMQSRLDMACSLVQDPRVLILDEPTEDLDPALRREIVRLIRKINSLGTTVIMTTHILEDVEDLCDRVAVLHRGTITHLGSVDDLRTLLKKKDELVVETASGNYQEMIRQLGIQEFALHDGKLLIHTTNAQGLLPTVLSYVARQGDTVRAVTITRPSLREIFEDLTGRDL